MEHEAIKAPEEGSKGFSGSGGGENEGAFATGNHGPAEALGSGRSVEDGLEPLGRDRVETGERIDLRAGVLRGHDSLEDNASSGEEEAKERGAVVSRQGSVVSD